MNLISRIANNTYFNTIKAVRELLDIDQKKRMAIMLLLLLLNAFFDVAGLSIILPITKIALQPEIIHTNEYINWVYQFLGVKNEMTFLFVLSLGLLFVLFAKNAIALFILHTQSKFAFNISLRMSIKQFQHYYEQGYLHIKAEDSGTKTYNVVLIPYLFASNIIIQLLLLTTEIAVVLLILGAMFWYNYLLMLITISVITPAFLAIYMLSKKQVNRIGTEKNIKYPKLYSTILESLDAYENVKLANKEQQFLEHYRKQQGYINGLDTLMQGIFLKIPQKSNEIIAGLGIVVIFLFLLLFPNNQSSLITVLAAFGLAAFRIMPSINRIMDAILTIKSNQIIIDKLSQLKNKKTYSFPIVNKLPFKNSIRLENISYSYSLEDVKVLDNISLTIKKGETIGFIGESGSGKTTLLHLLLRFLKETSGTIYMDNHPIEDDNINAAFQKNIGFVQQSVFIKDGTLEENIAFGESNIDQKKLDTVIQQSMLSSLVKTRKEGVKMQLGENGSTLSGGQKQRVGIARALYKDAEIIVFDEATSALDTETEQMITESINNLTGLNKTIFIVAHRITTLHKCDRIYELKKGKIINQYKYKELFNERFI